MEAATSSNSAYQFDNPSHYDTVPKTGSITEYQTNYHGVKSRERNKPVLSKMQDTLSFGDKRFINDPPQFGGSTESLNSGSLYLDGNNGAQNYKSSLKSKNLNRLNNMVPEKTLSWYKGDHGFYGNSSELNSGSQLPANSSNNSSTSFKNDYIKKFEEFNSGLVDSYSITKGGVYLSGKDGKHEGYNSQRLPLSAQNMPSEQKLQTPRDYDLRSAWIPKKFEGRNMFASHIESTIFPDKARRASPLIEKQSTYEKPDKSVRYAMSNDNKIVAHMSWKPTNLAQSSTHGVKPAHRPIRSSYQDDFEDSSAAFFRANSSNIPASTSTVSDMRKSKC